MEICINCKQYRQSKKDPECGDCKLLQKQGKARFNGINPPHYAYLVNEDDFCDDFEYREDH